jgi:hypothetical protein
MFCRLQDDADADFELVKTQNRAWSLLAWREVMGSAACFGGYRPRGGSFASERFSFFERVQFIRIRKHNSDDFEIPEVISHQSYLLLRKVRAIATAAIVPRLERATRIAVNCRWPKH